MWLPGDRVGAWVVLMCVGLWAAILRAKLMRRGKEGE